MPPSVNGLGPKPPREMFMNVRDIALWMRSAHADAHLARLRQQHGSKAFDLLYDELEDPWGAATKHYRYQRRKYAVLLSLLPARQYRHALDLGCGFGGMVRLLAPYAEEVLGLDISRPAIEQAKQLSIGFSNLHYEQADALALDPALNKRFDLVVLADALYYLSPLDDEVLKRVRERIVSLLTPGGVLLLANHFFFALDPDSRLSRHIHDSFRWASGLQLKAEYRKPFYLVGILENQS